MQRIKHRKVILMAVIAALLFSGVTAAAAGSREFSGNSASDLMEETHETDQAAETDGSEGSGPVAETDGSEGTDQAEEIEVIRETQVQEGKEENEELTIPAGVWSDREPFFTNDGSKEAENRPFRMARATGACPTYQEAYAAMVNLQDKYPEGMTWTNFDPYGSTGKWGEYYRFRGGSVKGASLGVGCAAFAFILSDEAFGSLPSRTIDRGGFSFEDIKVGDILRVNNNSHFVIVLQVSAGGVTVAEANYNKSVHWGRAVSVEDIMAADFLVTRYPDGYTEDDNADGTAHEGTEGPLSWTLTNAGVLTVSGTGDMPNYTQNEGPSWKGYIDDINTIIIEHGVTSIGDYAFYESKALTAYIPDGVTSIGNGAFQNSKLVAVTIPKTTASVKDNAFRGCENLASASISEGVESIGEETFRACTALRYLDFPASITSVGAGAFTSCRQVVQIRFKPGTGAVKIGDSAFAQCQWLQNVTLPQGLEAISSNMFQSCTLLAEIYIPANVSEIGMNPFTGTYIQRGGTISFGGSETTWKSIGGQYILNAMPMANIKYDVPFDDPFAADPDDPGDFTPANPDEGGDSGDHSDSGSDDKPGSHADPGSSSAAMASSATDSGIKAVVKTWRPTTPDEAKRYACMGKEVIHYTQSKDSAYQVDIKNAMQGPGCFKSFEAVLGDYTIGRTYNIYPLSNAAYRMDEEIQVTVEIPSSIYKKDREYKMICVTKGGLAFIYSDLDNNPETITIKTNNFYAYALIYK